jgi:hypothetical protein
MTRTRLLTLLLGCTIALGFAAHGQTETSLSWPDSPAGHTARDYFAMLTDGSDGAIRNFETTYRLASALAKIPLDERVKKTQDLRLQLGELTPTAILEAGSNVLRVAAKGAKGDVELEFQMDQNEPTKVASIAIKRVGEGPEVESRALTTAARNNLVKSVAQAVADEYVFPDLGKTMADMVRKASAGGAYAAITDERSMAHRLTDDLRSVSHDRHLAVSLSPAEPGTPAMHSMAAGPASDNYGFRRVELFAGNIGLVQLDEFMSTVEALQAADSAMASLRHAEAIIFDLRRNKGGDPAMIQHLASYLFSARTHLNSLVDRAGIPVQDFWTGDIPGTRFRDSLPVYVLTSAFTFSCGEEFTYDLKNLKRAIIVGETTGGGAHPVKLVKVDDRFAVTMPFLRALNPVTKTDWEGVGVEPDVKISSDAALGKALELARAAIQQSSAGARS